MYSDTAIESALCDIRKERVRQDALKAKGAFPFTCADDGLMPSEKLAVLMEEVGEAAPVLMLKKFNTNRDAPRELRKELVQIAAVCAAWIEGIDNNDRRSVTNE